ncbi:MAG: DUF2878 domain-containing protein [Planctomycetota bacterium]|jgi:hypothetical protein
MTLILRLIALKAGWLACVYGAAEGLPWVGPVVVLWLTAVSLNFSRDYMTDACLGLVVMIAGSASDLVLVVADLIAFPEHARIGAPTPAWMMALWFQLGVHFRGLFQMLKGRPLQTAILGGILGPLACLGGRGLGAIEFEIDTTTTACLMGQYAFNLLVFERVLVRLDGLTQRQFANHMKPHTAKPTGLNPTAVGEYP